MPIMRYGRVTIFQFMPGPASLFKTLIHTEACREATSSQNHF